MLFDHIIATTPGDVLSDVGRSLREAFFMFWETLWPLVLGFGLSGAVQAFATRQDMERSLGNHRPAAIARASGYGMVSSSCSYAASAMAKSLFQKGADFVSAMVFMFASTNLVIELGIVLAVLIGWQFTAAEFVGGPIMIVFLALLGGIALRPGLVALARRVSTQRLSPAATTISTAARRMAIRVNGGNTANTSNTADTSDTANTEKKTRPSWRRQLRTRAAWSNAAGYTMADLKMLRREMAVGYLAAGFLAVLVPDRVWATLFVHGHGIWTSIENALVGPVIAFLSFVCSIGNVPLAAALWKGGISFGGVISFIFADLVAAPLVLIYRRYYGGALTLRLVGLFWAVMAAAGLIVGALFSATGLVPQHRPTQIVTTSFSWGYTTILNIIFLAGFGVLYWLYRSRDLSDNASGYATDPVCGMRILVTAAPARRVDGDETYWFCSDRCAWRFQPGQRQTVDPAAADHAAAAPQPAH